jgi:glucose-6-phosphate isomerase
MSALTRSDAWQALTNKAGIMAGLSIRQLFDADSGRFERFSLRAGPLLIDYSKQRIDPGTMELLRALARQQDLAGWTARLFAGEHVNHTESRAALHMALRNRSARPMRVDGIDVMPRVREVLARMRLFSEEVRSGRATGSTGEPFKTVINIGIGGSDLGPAMVVKALRAEACGPRVRFVSNVDHRHIAEALREALPESTLFIVASKTFATQETMTNAATARAWLSDALGPAAVASHFVAVSANPVATAAFGITPDRVFEFWDWVGGRYSLWSAIGLPIALAVGMDAFEDLLSGAHLMDEHFRDTDPVANAPSVLAALAVWNRNFLGHATHAVLPYAQDLRLLPAYLQQLDMESNGKRIDRDGALVDYDTGPVLWGAPGTDGQHAFFQLLHQGSQTAPADFIAVARGTGELPPHQEILLANCLAQSQALAFGKSQERALAEMLAGGMDAGDAARLAPYRAFPGNRPSTTILLESLSPAALGALIALYEHRVFVQAVLWNINPFDQWGVELGKQLASRLLPPLVEGGPGPALDASTRGLVDAVRAWRSSALPSDR